MQVANEMRSAVKNIRYYVDIIRGLNSKQFDLDIDDQKMRGGTEDEPILKGNRVRFSGEIGDSCEVILTGCQNIERQVQIAEDAEKN